MSEKPSGIAHHAVIHYLACISLSIDRSLPLSLEISRATVDTSWCRVTCQWLHHLVCVHALAMAQLYNPEQNWLISIDLTINSCREFEFTIKTMNALLSDRFTHHQRVASTCYSQLQQFTWLKDFTIFPIINYFLVRYPIFPFFLYMFTSQLTTCYRIVLVTAMELEHTSCAQCQLKWWMMIMMIMIDDGDWCWWIMMMDDNG